LASIGKTGGLTGRRILHCARALYPEVNGWDCNRCEVAA